MARREIITVVAVANDLSPAVLSSHLSSDKSVIGFLQIRRKFKAFPIMNVLSIERRFMLWI